MDFDGYFHEYEYGNADDFLHTDQHDHGNGSTDVDFHFDWDADGNFDED